jgi:glycosyltransferase involved in cell wall biosynthesis
MFIKNPVCVGIPCFNEEKSISYTIASILAQKNIPDLEIIVCVNGSTDKTEENVRALAANNPKIQLIRAPRGKPNAWNLIRETTSCQYIMFTDGDVILSENVIFDLYCKLKESSNTIASTSKVITLAKQKDMLSLGSLNSDSMPKYPLLSGGGYLIDNFKLSKHMAKQGFNAMPPNIINEDRWLSGIISQERIVICSQAKIYQLETSSFLEIISRYVRQSVGRHQIQQEFPLISKFSQVTLKEQLLTKFVLWKTLDKSKERLLFPLAVGLRFIIRSICNLLARYLYSMKIYSNKWRPAITTKDGKLLNQLYLSERL